MLNPADIFCYMRNAGVLDVILPEATSMARLRNLIQLEAGILGISGVAPDGLRRLAALLDPNINEAALLSVAARLKISKTHP